LEQNTSAGHEQSLPPGVTLQDVLAALSSQSPPAPSAPLTAADLSAMLSLPFTPSTLVSSSNTNTRAFHCMFCSTVILLPATASYRQRRTQLPPLASSRGGDDEYVEHMWVVKDQMEFENVGVTRAVGGVGAEGGDGGVNVTMDGVRYLCCGNCDRGPIGVTFASEPSIFYVAHGRVQYK